MNTKTVIPILFIIIVSIGAFLVSFSVYLIGYSHSAGVLPTFEDCSIGLFFSAIFAGIVSVCCTMIVKKKLKKVET